MTDDTLRQSALKGSIAAAKANRARAALPVGRPAVFVTRDEHSSHWEIRRYGAIALLLGAERFSTPAEARFAGEAALSEMVMPLQGIDPLPPIEKPTGSSK